MLATPRLSRLCLLSAIAASLTLFSADGQERRRRNLFGMHNLKDGGPSFAEGMEWTQHLVGRGWVFDWVSDFEPWIEKAFQLNLVPCIRVQEGRGGARPDPGYAQNVAWIVLNYKIAHPQYADRLVYLQLWNEPSDPRDSVPPDVYADYLVAAHGAIHQAESQAAAAHPNLALGGTLKTMTPGQNGPSWWERAFTHNPDAKFAFDAWGTHPYPEATPPHYNLHDGDVFIETSKTVDSYLMDLDVVARPHGNPPRSRRGFPVMITETAYGNKLGISYEGWPKTNRQLAAAYNVDAFGKRWYRWPEILAVHPFILANLSWENFAWVQGSSGSEDGSGDGVREPTRPYPQYTAVRELRLDLEADGMAPARLTPYRGATGSIKGRVARADGDAPLPYVTLRTDGYEFGHVSLYDGKYEIHGVPAGSYTLTAEKNGFRAASQSVTVSEGASAAVDFSLVHIGRVSRGIYFVDSFAGHSGCPGCSLFDPSLGQTFRTPPNVGYIKYVAAKPNIDGVTLKFSILEGGPSGPQVGAPITATLEPGDGAIMIGGEWPDGGEPVVEPGATYFLNIERADGQGIYGYASNSNPYPDGNAYVGGRSIPGVDFYAVIRGLTLEVNTSTGNLTGVVEDPGNAPIAGATVTVDPVNRSTSTDDSGGYNFAALPIGRYQVSASRAGYSSGSVSGVEVFENQVTTVNFTLEPRSTTGTLRGNVRDTSSNPLSGVEVSTTAGGYRTNTDAGGGYVLLVVEAGTYTLQAVKAGYAPYVQTGVTVAAGETTTVDIRLAPVIETPPVIVNPDFEDDRGFFGVARGWTRFGGSKWEAVWDPVRIFTQGVSDLPPSGDGGVFQTISVAPGRRYRVTVQGKTTNSDYEVAVGADAAFGAPSRSASWASLSVEFAAGGAQATIFLRGRNTRAQFVSGWVQFDGVTIETVGNGNAPPTAVASANPTSGSAPLQVQFNGTGSSDPEGDALTYDWNFGDGSPHGVGPTVSHIYSGAGAFNAVLTVSDGGGGQDTDTLTITVTGAVNLIGNGDFSRGLENWLAWTERGAPNPRVEAGQLRLGSSNHNGGVYQSFSTGSAGKSISVEGFWASDPTLAQKQWAEVLVINGPRQPVNGQDIHAGQPDVVLLYKNDTWVTPGGWSGDMAQTAPVARAGAFVAAASVATLVLKSGNAGGAVTGTRFDNLVITGPAPPGNQNPHAVAVANPRSGAAPLQVQFDGTSSSDPDGDPLSYSWRFGDGGQGTGPSPSHTYQQPGIYVATLSVADGRGGAHDAQVTIEASAVGGPNLVTNGGFEAGFANGVAQGWSRWSAVGTGYWKPSSRLGRIGSGSYASSTPVANAVIRLSPKLVLLEGNALGMAAAIRAALPDALIVGRLFIDPRVSEYLESPELFGRRHAEDCFNQGRTEVNVWQGMNEPDLNDVENARRVARFEKAFSDRLHELGLKSVVLNIAVGNPGNMENMLLPEIVDLLSSADYVGYHAYGGIQDQLMVGPESPWFAHRFRFYVEMYRERGFRMPPVLYTECTTFYAWKRGHTQPGYAPFEPRQIRDDLIAFEGESRADPWSVGMAIFLLGSSSPRWDGWEVSNEPVIYEGAGDYNFNHPTDAKAGLFSQQFGAEGSELEGGIVQAVQVEPGATYQLQSSMKYETYGASTAVRFRIGYDLTGQTANPRAASIEWSEDLVALESRETDTWYSYARSFTASGPSASVWIEGAQGPGYDRFRVSVDEVGLSKLDAPFLDSGTVWNEEPMEEFLGAVVRGWTPWYQGSGEREWNRVAGEGGWAQEVKKSNVQVGIYRENRGFLAGDTYRVQYRAKVTTGNGIPHASLGVRAGSGGDLAGVAWSPAVTVTRSGWTDVTYDFVAENWTTTIFLRADLSGVQDGGVALDNLKVERVTPRAPPSWVLDGSPPVEPRYIHGMHDPGAEHLFNQKGRQGWVVHAIGIGDDPADHSGRRFSEWVDGHGVIVRISYGFGDTLPHPSRFAQFAQRSANFVKSSVGAGIWSIANEPGLERAGGVPLTPELYAEAYLQCRRAIKAVRPNAVVITAGMVQGDLDFFERTMRLIEDQADGIAIHSYTNANYFNEAAFNLYRAMMDRIPASMHSLPVYMTEAGNGATGPYPDQNTGFIDLMFRNVDEWNRSGRQPIRAVAFYRWRNFDQWGIETKPGMIQDFLSALDGDYAWRR